MKIITKSIIVLLITNICCLSYPQAMLIKEMSKKEEKIVIVDKVIKEKSNGLDINVIIPEVKGLKDKAQESKFNNNVLKWTEDWIRDVKLNISESFKGEDTSNLQYELYSRYKVTKESEKIISMYIDYYQYTGGAHGITTRKSFTLDLNSEELLPLKGLFKNEYNYKDKIDNHINIEINKDKDKYFIGKEGFNGVRENQDYYIEDNSLVIYFQEYEIAPYVAGIVEFKMDLDIFENNYLYDKIKEK